MSIQDSNSIRTARRSRRIQSNSKVILFPHQRCGNRSEFRVDLKKIRKPKCQLKKSALCKCRIKFDSELKATTDLGVEVNAKITKTGNVVVKVGYTHPYYYTNSFFRLNARVQQHKLLNFPLMSLFGSNNPLKEITENMAGVSHLTNIGLPETGVLCLVHGDGVGPRAGVMVAMKKPGWTVCSIDPLMRLGEDYTNFPNLHLYRSKVEDCIIDLPKAKYYHVAMLGVHSHADVDALWKLVVVAYPNAARTLISVLCCKGFKQQIEDLKPNKDFRDYEIMSMNNRVMIWTDNS